MPRQLLASELKIGNLPQIPMQPSPALIQCSGGLDYTLDNANGEWSVVQDHPPCAVSGNALPAVKATATEMAKLHRRPLVAFQLAPNGLISGIRLLQSSGSTTLDQRAMSELG